jgi:hypothetical protein
VGVCTFQPSFDFKDFHHAARLHPLAGGHQSLDGEKQVGLRPPPLSFKDAYILVGAESEASRGSASRPGRLAASSSSFWWWKPSLSSVEEASSSHAGEGELLLPS